MFVTVLLRNIGQFKLIKVRWIDALCLNNTECSKGTFR